MNVDGLIKGIKRNLPKIPIIQVDYASLEMRIVESLCGKCPICDEPLFDDSVSGFTFSDPHAFLLKSHLAKQTDNAHAVFEVMNL
jgi:hypothetical protein